MEETEALAIARRVAAQIRRDVGDDREAFLKAMAKAQAKDPDVDEAVKVVGYLADQSRRAQKH